MCRRCGRGGDPTRRSLLCQGARRPDDKKNEGIGKDKFKQGPALGGCED